MKTPVGEVFAARVGGGLCVRETRPSSRGRMREIFGPLVERVEKFPAGRHPWLMAEVPAEGSLPAFFRDLEKRLSPVGVALGRLSQEAVRRGARVSRSSWIDVQKAGLAAGLVDNKIAAFSPRLTSIRFVIPLARRKGRAS